VVTQVATMVSRRYKVGDLVFSRIDIYNDGGVPDAELGALLAVAGTRGIVIRAGRERGGTKATIYIVRFEGPDQLLGPPVGCLDEELTHDADDPLSAPSGERPR